MMKEEVSISRVNISTPKGCEVVFEKCKNEAYWFVGLKSICDKHMKQLCKKMGWNYKGLIKEAQSKGD